jgi:hypothetical protein
VAQGSLQLGHSSTRLCAGSGSPASMSDPSPRDTSEHRTGGLTWARWSREPHIPTRTRTNRHQQVRPLAGAFDKSRGLSRNALLVGVTIRTLVSAVAGGPASRRSDPAQSAAPFCSFMASSKWPQPAPTVGIHNHYRNTAVFRAVPDCTARPPINNPAHTAATHTESHQR